jgi:hypothetical protein
MQNHTAHNPLYLSITNDEIEKADDHHIACLFLHELYEELNARDKQQNTILFIILVLPQP